MSGLRKVTITNTKGSEHFFAWIGRVGTTLADNASIEVTEAELNHKIYRDLYRRAAEKDIDAGNASLSYSS